MERDKPAQRMTTPVRPSVERRVAGALAPALGPSFARGLWRIAAADVSSANKIRILHDGPATFAAMIDAINDAVTSIRLECYIFRSDEVGKQFAAALIAARERGVSIQLLLDWIGVRGTSRAMITSMKKAGVEIAIFNPPGFRAWLG